MLELQQLGKTGSRFIFSSMTTQMPKICKAFAPCANIFNSVLVMWRWGDKCCHHFEGDKVYQLQELYM